MLVDTLGIPQSSRDLRPPQATASSAISTLELVQIAFFTSEVPDLTPQRKGGLFERLTRRLVELAGYTDVQLRAKHSSLEYDVEGRHRLTSRTLTAEAKAHEANIAGQVLSSFVGKVFPLALRGPIDALFISTSPLTAEARDYRDGLVAEGFRDLPLSFRTLVGTEIPQFLAESGACLSEDMVRARVASATGLEVIDTWLVASEFDDFLLCSAAQTAIGAPTHYSALTRTGDDLRLDPDALRRLQTQVSQLEGLVHVPLVGSPAPVGVAVHPPELRIPPVVAGAGWFDYKFPTPPECFIGRDAALSLLARDVRDIGLGATATRCIQVLSRSGVGKSSLLLKLPSVVPSSVAVTVDGRNIRTTSDSRLLVGQVVDAVNAAFDSSIDRPRSQEAIEESLAEVGRQLVQHSHVALVEIDQFESLLLNPLVFEELLDLIATITTRGLPIVFVLARKNDLAATYDESATIDLGRLNELSESLALVDFTAGESRALLEVLAAELGQALDSALAEAILTFSAGFPWLHKRLCAHVLTLQELGVSQRDMLQTGLRAEDLFEEDLAGLTEQDKALLRTLAAHLPSTASELTRRLESEVSAQRLTNKLNEFLGRKLLRLSGDVYDTYNDVFKTYLVTDRVPFQSRYIMRTGPGSSFPLLERVAELGRVDLQTFNAHIGGSMVGMLNRLRELRLLGLISPEPGWVALSPQAQAAIESDSVGELLRRSLRANALVVRVLDLLASSDNVQMSDIATELGIELPHVELTEERWLSYAQTLANWLRFAGLAHVEGDQVRLRETPGDELLSRRAFSRGSFTADTFLPSVRPNRVVELISILSQGPTPLKELSSRFGATTVTGLLRDASSLDLVAIEGDAAVLGRQGRVLRDRDSVSERDVAALSLTKPNVRALLTAAGDRALMPADERELLSRFGSADWAEGTWRWRLGILRAWVVATGLAVAGKRGLRAT